MPTSAEKKALQEEKLAVTLDTVRLREDRPDLGRKKGDLILSPVRRSTRSRARGSALKLQQRQVRKLLEQTNFVYDPSSFYNTNKTGVVSITASDGITYDTYFSNRYVVVQPSYAPKHYNLTCKLVGNPQ